MDHQQPTNQDKNMSLFAKTLALVFKYVGVVFLEGV